MKGTAVQLLSKWEKMVLVFEKIDYQRIADKLLL
jgi:hypothetical protein